MGHRRGRLHDRYVQLSEIIRETNLLDITALSTADDDGNRRSTRLVKAHNFKDPDECFYMCMNRPEEIDVIENDRLLNSAAMSRGESRTVLYIVRSLILTMPFSHRQLRFQVPCILHQVLVQVSALERTDRLRSAG